MSSISIFLFWNPPPVLGTHGIIQEYHINLTEEETGAQYVYTSSNTSLSVSMLHPYYTYQWSVAAATIEIGPYIASSNSITTHQDGIH